MHLTKEKAWKALRAAVFLLIVCISFTYVTYLFRNADANGRKALLTFYDEEKDSLDVAYIGSSAVYRYWNPMKGWEDYGATSMAYASSGMRLRAYMAALQEVHKYQPNAVILLEARGLMKAEEDVGIMAQDRRVFDSIDIGIDRFRYLYYYQKRTGVSWNEMLTEYLDLTYYHTNYYSLRNPKKWALVTNSLSERARVKRRYKRFSIIRKTVPMEDPSGNRSDEEAELSEMQETMYRDILEWARKNQIKLVMVASPWIYSETDYQYYNTFKRIAEEYDVPFVNGNDADAQEAMDLNYETDLYNLNHVNISGATKYTGYLFDYLTEHYTFNAGNKSESVLNSWEKEYLAYQNALNGTEEVMTEAETAEQE